MAHVLITLRIMPSSPDADLGKIQEIAEAHIREFGGNVHKCEIEPIAFGLKAVCIQFVSDEEKGSTEALEEKIIAIPQVESAQVTGVTRLLG